jgi:putative transcriptional regulator
MKPTHHPEPDELLGYANGTAPEGASLVIACHLTYCAECREEIALLEDLGGALLETDAAASEGAPPRLPDLSAPPRPAPPPPPIVPGAEMLPRPLHGYLADKPRFRFLVPNAEHIPLSFSVGGIPARVIKFGPGFTIPTHRHEGTERLLVLDGVLTDETSGDVYRTGDVSHREMGTSHSQHVPKEAGHCICLAVSDAPVTPSTLWGKLLKAVTGV